MLPRADSTPECLGLVAVGGDVTPLTASKAKRIWTLFLKRINIMPTPREPNTSLAEKAKDLLSQDGSHHR